MDYEMEAVIPDFEPHPLLKSGHAMTIVSAFVPRRFDIPPAEARRFQGDKDSWLFRHCHWHPEKRKHTPILVLVYVRSGSSDSNCVPCIPEKDFHRPFHFAPSNQ